MTGRWDQKVTMPPGVAAEAIAGGMKPGAALKNFCPTLVAALLKKYDARALYDEFEDEIAQDCGGKSWSGWDSKKIHAKVVAFQSRFREKGIRVNYHMVTWQQWQSNGQYGGHMQTHFRYWMTYADIEMAAGTPGDAFDPDLDYEAEAKKYKGGAVGATAEGADEPDPPPSAPAPEYEKPVPAPEPAVAPAPPAPAPAKKEEDDDVDALLADVGK